LQTCKINYTVNSNCKKVTKTKLRISNTCVLLLLQ